MKSRLLSIVLLASMFYAGTVNKKHDRRQWIALYFQSKNQFVKRIRSWMRATQKPRSVLK